MRISFIVLSLFISPFSPSISYRLENDIRVRGAAVSRCSPDGATRTFVASSQPSARNLEARRMQRALSLADTCVAR